MISPFDSADVLSALSAALPEYLNRQRWFGDKSRSIDSVEVTARFDIERSNSPMAIAVLEVHFDDGPLSRYLLPISVVAETEDENTVICSISSVGQTLLIRDAIHESTFRDWILELLIDGTTLQTGRGHLEIDQAVGSSESLRSVRGSGSRVLQAEQSNSSILLGESVFVKLFRRLQDGVNPDAELVRFLTVSGGFANVPAYLASISYRSQSGDTAVVAMAQKYIESAGDGWHHALALLENVLNGEPSKQGTSDAETFAGALGNVTANMHLALASDPWSPELAPEVIDEDDVAGWQSDYLRMLKSVVEGLNEKQTTFENYTGELVRAFLGIARGLENRAQGFDRLIGRSKTRVHGDYHLGQTLLSANGELVILDFEGEPQRSLAERRRKTSPLKDVAGMLRSFSYARGSIANTLDPGQVQESAALIAWERAARASFLHAYTTTARQGGGRFTPESPSDFEEALAAWELDKAVYEVLYELNNRPGWLWIPLTGMLKFGEP